MKSIIVTLLLAVSSSSAFAEGGMGTRGGSDGLRLKLNQARSLALGALKRVTAERLVSRDPVIHEFYLKNHQQLLEEVMQSTIVVRPKKEVVALIAGTPREVLSITGFYPLSDILVSEPLAEASSLEVLSGLLIHEAGHHTGHRDENMDSELAYGKNNLLDDLAVAVLETAKQDPSFMKALQTSVGQWSGPVKPDRTITAPTISLRSAVLSYDYFTIEGGRRNAYEFCRMLGYNSAKSYVQKITVYRGVPGERVMISKLRPGGKLAYKKASEAEPFLDFYPIRRNGYGGGIQMKSITCSDIPIELETIQETHLDGVDDRT